MSLGQPADLRNQPFFLAGNSRSAYLLLHGLGGGPFEMQLLGEFLHGKGFTVQAVVYPGHDQPTPVMPTSTWQSWYAHVVAAYEALGRLYPLRGVIGFSTGCCLGLYLAAHYPVEKLVLLSPYRRLYSPWYSLLPLEVYLNSLGKLVTQLPRLSSPINDPAMARLATAVGFFKTFNLGAVRSANELIRQLPPLLPGITCPVLTIQSRRDQVVDPHGAWELHQELGSERKRFVWLEQSNHVITLDRERQQVFEEVACFLAEG